MDIMNKPKIGPMKNNEAKTAIKYAETVDILIFFKAKTLILTSIVHEINSETRKCCSYLIWFSSNYKKIVTALNSFTFSREMWNNLSSGKKPATSMKFKGFLSYFAKKSISGYFSEPSPELLHSRSQVFQLRLQH